MLLLDPTTGMRVVVTPSVQSSLVPHQERLISRLEVINRSELRASNEAHSQHWSRYERTENSSTIYVYGDCLRHTRPRPRNVAA